MSEGKRKVTFVKEVHSYLHHLDRYTYGPNVLSGEGLTGRCYWAVDWDSAFGMGAAVADWNQPHRLELLLFLRRFSAFQSFPSHPEWEFTWTSASVFCVSTVFLRGTKLTPLRRIETTFIQPLHAGHYVPLNPSAETNLQPWFFCLCLLPSVSGCQSNMVGGATTT